ncbi:MAG: HNH endonuclease, partial [Deltaproteobacteria bacterium]
MSKQNNSSIFLEETKSPILLSTAHIPIPQRIRNEKLVEAQNQCTYESSDGKRCPQRLWLELHHIKPISQGGGNQKENLIFLCSSHH